MCVSDIAPAPPSGHRARRSLAARTAGTVGRHISEVFENEELASRPGLLQRIEPRSRLLLLLMAAVAVSLVHSPLVLASLALAEVGLASASLVPVRSFVAKVWGSAGLFAALVVVPAATRLITPGPVIVPLGVLSLTVPGVLGAITLVLRVVASAGVALLIVWTMRWSDLLGAFSALRMPEVVVSTLAMTQQQVMSLLRTVEQIHLARESRTLTVGTAAENREWVIGRMAFVMKKSIKTADDVYDAMLARGFAGTIRTIRRTRADATSWLLLAAGAVTCALAIGIDRLVAR
jgi:cobalt/nickel transport system permease protein